MKEQFKWIKPRYYTDSIYLFIAIPFLLIAFSLPFYSGDLEMEFSTFRVSDWIILIVCSVVFLLGIYGMLRSISDFRFKFYYNNEYFVIKRVFKTYQIYYKDIEHLKITNTYTFRNSPRLRTDANRIKITGNSNISFLLHSHDKEKTFYNVLIHKVSKDKRQITKKTFLRNL